VDQGCLHKNRNIIISIPILGSNPNSVCALEPYQASTAGANEKLNAHTVLHGIMHI
jgi:hypothetical protein